MKIIIFENKVCGIHDESQEVSGKYPQEYEICRVPDNTEIDMETMDDPRLSMAVEDVKKYRIIDMKEKINRDILTQYPIYKQLNIARLGSGYTQNDLDIMTAVIDTFRATSDDIEAEINAADTIEDVLAITF